MERMAAMSLVGVTAHGSPGGPLQFGRLEATLAAEFHCNVAPRRPCSRVDLRSKPVCRRKEISMLLILLIIVLVLVFGGGGGYYGYRRWGTGGGVGIGGLILIIVLVLYLFGGLRL